MSSARVFTAKVKLLVGVGALAPLLITTGLFRAGENAMQTSFAPFGHEVLHITTSVIGLVVTISGIVMVLSNLLLTSKIRAEKLPALLVMGLGLLSLSFVLLRDLYAHSKEQHQCQIQKARRQKRSQVPQLQLQQP